MTTLRRHLEANHSVSARLYLWPCVLIFFQGKYRRWAAGATFESKLPGDVKKRKEAAETITRTLDRELKEKILTERVVPYSDKLFRQASIEWLVATDQPIQALEHPKFKEMIDVASRATNGVKIPGRKATRAEIKCVFKGHLTKLKVRLNVSVLIVACLLFSLYPGTNCQWGSKCDLWCLAG